MACHVLEEGAIGYCSWQNTGLAISTDEAYKDFLDFSKQQRDYRPDGKSMWSKKIRTLLGPCVEDKRQTAGKERVRLFQFAPLINCQSQLAIRIGAPDLEWEPPDNELPSAPGVAVGQTAEDVGGPTGSDALQDAPSIEWEPELEPEPDNWSEYEPEDELEADE